MHIKYPLANKHNYGTSPCLMVKSTISMAIFNRYVELPEDIFEETIWKNINGKDYPIYYPIGSM
jgi:hypothetical protein